MNNTCAIFSVKTIRRLNGRYYTDGGFGLYIHEMCRHYSQVVLVCKESSLPPGAGFYPLFHERLTVSTVPAWPSELGAILVQPLVLLRGISAVRAADVVYARMPDWTGVSGVVLASLLKRPCVCQVIGDTAELARTIPPLKAYGLGLPLKAVLHLYNLLEVIACRNKLVFAQGIRAYYKHRRAREVNLVLSTAHSDKDIAPPKPRFRSSLFTILAVGRLQHVKNHELLLEALAVLRKSDKRWNLVIAGDGPRLQHLQELAYRLRIASAVAFAGRVDRGAALWDLYDTADVFVLPSLSEGTPKVILEAMARGCPVVAADVGGVRSAVADRERGLLFRSGDLNDLVHSITEMHAKAQLREHCQREANHFAKRHTIERATASIVSRVNAFFAGETRLAE